MGCCGGDSAPSQPDPYDASIAGAQADLENYPFRYQIEAAAKMGQKITIDGKTYDFTGLGDASQQLAMSDKMTQALIDIQKNYGADYIKQRLAELQRADPQGYAARKQLFQKIISDADKNPDRPLAEDTQASILSMLNQGGSLGSGAGSELEQVQQGVRANQARSGLYLGNAPAFQEAQAVEKASESARTRRQQQAIAFQTAGVSPEDVSYRRVQQSLSNLSSAINGQTPLAQFSNLSSAGNGAVPFSTTTPNNQATDPNAAAASMGFASSIYGTQSRAASSQVNPWISSLSTVAGGIGTAANMGWNPFSGGSKPAASSGQMWI